MQPLPVGQQTTPAGAFDLAPIVAEGEPAPGRETLVVTQILTTASSRSGSAAVSLELDDPATPERERFYSIFLNDGLPSPFGGPSRSGPLARSARAVSSLTRDRPFGVL